MVHEVNDTAWGDMSKRLCPRYYLDIKYRPLLFPSGHDVRLAESLLRLNVWLCNHLPSSNAELGNEPVCHGIMVQDSSSVCPLAALNDVACCSGGLAATRTLDLALVTAGPSGHTDSGWQGFYSGVNMLDEIPDRDDVGRAPNPGRW
ncbi:hypothetical protein CBL_20976 [Carabus blaptoides fortunei]